MPEHCRGVYISTLQSTVVHSAEASLGQQFKEANSNCSWVCDLPQGP